MRGYGRHSRPHGLRGRGRGAGTCAGRLTGRRAAPQIVLDWLGKLLGLPPAFLAVGPGGARGRGGGVIQGTASEATLVALRAARARALAGRPAADALRLFVERASGLDGGRVAGLLREQLVRAPSA